MYPRDVNPRLHVTKIQTQEELSEYLNKGSRNNMVDFATQTLPSAHVIHHERYYELSMVEGKSTIQIPIKLQNGEGYVEELKASIVYGNVPLSVTYEGNVDGTKFVQVHDVKGIESEVTAVLSGTSVEDLFTFVETPSSFDISLLLNVDFDAELKEAASLDSKGDMLTGLDGYSQKPYVVLQEDSNLYKLFLLATPNVPNRALTEDRTVIPLAENRTVIPLAALKEVYSNAMEKRKNIEKDGRHINQQGSKYKFNIAPLIASSYNINKVFIVKFWFQIRPFNLNHQEMHGSNNLNNPDSDSYSYSDYDESSD